MFLPATSTFTMAAKTALPTAITGLVLFCFAALIEAFISPAPIAYEYKAGVAIASTLLLLFYYFGLGFAAKYRTTEESESRDIDPA